MSVIPFGKTKASDGFVGASGGWINSHYRHHVDEQRVWFFFGPEEIYFAGFRELSESGRPMPGLYHRYEGVAPKKFGGLAGNSPAPGVAIEFVPLSEKEVRVFFFVMRTKKIESWETEWALERSKDKRVRWKAVADERNPETIESLFTEDFYVFKRGTDYFFVTESGKLYVAPPPKKGEKSRTMKAVWDDAKRPIVAVLEDAERGKVWLFANDKNPGAKGDLFFEMNEKVLPEVFDPAKLKPVDAPGRAKMLLEYLPLIRKE